MTYDFIRWVHTDSERALYRGNQITIMGIYKKYRSFPRIFLYIVHKNTILL